tara:strand:+ start:61 stop:720 length:660 start_codon:yes stop_codon:yes gene_type:complete
MGTRKNKKSKKSNKRFRKTRSKKQKGGQHEEAATQYLFSAIEFDDPDKIIAALNHGANVNAKNEDGKTPLMMVSTCDEELLDKPAYQADADIEIKKDIIELLIESGADFNMKNDDDDGKTALDYAKDTNFEEISCKEIVELLENYNERQKDKQNLAVIEAATRKNKTNMPPSMEKFFKINKGNRPLIEKWLGGKRKTRKSKKSIKKKKNKKKRATRKRT